MVNGNTLIGSSWTRGRAAANSGDPLKYKDRDLTFNLYRCSRSYRKSGFKKWYLREKKTIKDGIRSNVIRVKNNK